MLQSFPDHPATHELHVLPVLCSAHLLQAMPYHLESHVSQVLPVQPVFCGHVQRYEDPTTVHVPWEHGLSLHGPNNRNK